MKIGWSTTKNKNVLSHSVDYGFKDPEMTVLKNDNKLNHMSFPFDGYKNSPSDSLKTFFVWEIYST